jgi:hypothetical protein
MQPGEKDYCADPYFVYHHTCHLCALRLEVIVPVSCNQVIIFLLTSSISLTSPTIITRNTSLTRSTSLALAC